MIFRYLRVVTKTDAGTQEDSAAMQMERRGGYMRVVGSEVHPHKTECSQE